MEKGLTLYEELWECRFRPSPQVSEKPLPPAGPKPGLAEGIDLLFGKVE